MVTAFFISKERRACMSDNNEVVKHIYLKNIQPFADHPFEIRDDDAMKETVQSVKEYGVIMPVIVRQTDEGNYEMISGHRRMKACELAGIDTIPAIVRGVDRDTAIIMMVDSKAHIHNHIYFNSVALDCSHKHRDRKRSGKDIARLSDLICIEHHLSTITNPQHRNTSYTKWEGYTPYLSHRDLLRNDIDEVISMIPKDFDKFLELMKERDYEIKVGKHIAFKKKEQKKFIRLRSLGEGYSENEIRLSISE